MKKAFVATAILLAGCVAGTAATPRQEANRRALDDARPVGEPEDCISINRIRSSNVRSEDVIDFEMNDGRIMRSRLPQSCPGLAFEERFTYRTSLNRLCAVDTITVLDSSGRRGASCGLGPFQPVELPRR
ncbi:hypothetical protein [Sphingosinicella sp. CPCC 101087]|uniref:hypothetical protein n=1 Tax=Sphingosinicella sp. CPCC 101087 TaxID=2497754 RepID=UPI001FB0558D|nr:hypothetical protein [Sphingosinicella sp. CPCC 101087]